MLKAMTDKAYELGYKELLFTTKPEVMRPIVYINVWDTKKLSEENGCLLADKEIAYLRLKNLKKAFRLQKTFQH